MTDKPQTYTLEQLFDFVSKRYGSQPHMHDWAILDAQSPEPAYTNPRIRANTADNITNVLMKCHCGEVKTVTLQGRWTLSQLLIKIGEHNATSQARSTETPKDSQP